MALVWDERRMSTGVPEIDMQHQMLIDQLNLMFRMMHEGKGGAKLNELLEFCAKYALAHFAHEESCMHLHRCPAASANRTAHAEFIRVFTAFRKRLEVEGPTLKLTLEVQKQLSDWLSNHIVRTDTALRGCVRATADA